jgi:hypothetical protein
VTNAVSGVVKGTLRLEGLFVLIASVVGYWRFGEGWGVFAIWFLAPDLSFLGYLAGPRVGAGAYDLAHSYVGPLAVLGLVVATSSPALLPACLIWSAHLGLDRALGYGLKYSQGFGFTHLGPIGRVAKATWD